MKIYNDMGQLEWVFIVLGFLSLVLMPILILIDISRNKFSGNDKIIWILIVVCLPVLGSLLYLYDGMNQKQS